MSENEIWRAVKNNRGKPLLGAAAYTNEPAFVEIASELGFQLMWIEMEHTFISFAETANLCRLASARGLLTMVRIPDCNRENVLKAAECGPNIIDLPMANSPEQVAELVRHARFPPLGSRGYFSISRAVHYGLRGEVTAEQQRLNHELCLMIQIETEEAARRSEELCRVPGLDAVLLGPGDLSASLGFPGQTNHPRLLETAGAVVKIAKRHKKLVAVAVRPAEAALWADLGVDIIFCGDNVTCMKLGAQSLLHQVNKTLTDTVDKVSRVSE